MNETLEYTNDFLETLALFETDISLGMSISISILLWLKVIVDIKSLELKGHNVFAKSLLDATIQDGGTRERSNGNVATTLYKIDLDLQYPLIATNQ